MFEKKQGPFTSLHHALRAGEISRRTFIERSTALGMGAGVALMVADAAAQGTPEASPAASSVEEEVRTLPDSGTEGQTRGEGGELKIIQWQAPSQLNPLLATGDKDNLASQLVCESLLVRDVEGQLIANLVKEVPSLQNGLLAEDLTSVTYNLLEGVLWSDGEAMTANDVAFTVEWAKDPANPVVLANVYNRITEVEVIDDLTVKLMFDSPNPTWADAFAGSGSGVVLPKHILEGADENVLNEFRANPVGTGPFKVESFSANDQVTYVINENYRHENKPFFERVLLKGGGDAAAAARATLQTGEFDFGWNLNAERDVMAGMISDDNPGQFVVQGGLNVERININFSDPNTEVDGQRSEMNTPHPVLSDIAVRKAMQLGINRELISENLYLGMEAEPAVANVLTGIPMMESPNTELKYDPEAAKALLEEAGWVMDGDVRKKDGLELSLRLYTTVNAIRQKIQAIVKANLEQVGFKIELEQVDAAIFFDGAEGNEQNNTHFYTDMNMFTSSVSAPPPVLYMIRWYAGEDRGEVAQKSNGWSGRNIQRYINDEYDAIYEQAMIEPDLEKAAELFIQMNDILWNDAAVIPIIRQGKKVGVANSLNVENVAVNPFEYGYYNIANWNRVSV